MAADTTERTAPDLPELGAPGTNFFGGFLKTDEHVPELVGTKGLDVFEKMRRSDGMVKATLLALKQPIKGAEWSIKPGSDSATASGEDIATHLQRNLFHTMSMPFRDHLRQLLTHLDFGFYVCEIVWRVVERDGRIFYEIQKLAPRMQRTITKWNLADDGGLVTIEQQTFSGKSKIVPIPIAKLLVFTHDKEGANWTGTSALRPAYKHWWIKDQLYRIGAIAAERHGVGIPHMELPPDKDDTTNVERAEDILMGIRAHERGFVVTPAGYIFSIKGMGEGRPLDVLPTIEHHDRRIGMSVLAQFLSLGGSTEGSHALSADQSSFFLQAERDVADHIADVHNRYLIPQWVRFNYGQVEELPELVCGRIETRDLVKFFTALATAAGQQLITPDDPMEDALRKSAGLPPRDPATSRKRVAPDPAPQPQPAGQPPGTEPPPGDGGAADA